MGTDVRCAYCADELADCRPFRHYALCWRCLVKQDGRAIRNRGFWRALRLWVAG